MLSLLKKSEIRIINDLFDKKLKGILYGYDRQWSDRYNEYFDGAFRQNDTRDLITHLNDNFVEGLDYRHGATTVMGMLGQALVHTGYVMNGFDVAPQLDKISQSQEIDLKFWTRGNKIEIVDASVKLNHLRGDGTIRLADDYFNKVGPTVTSIDFADIYNPSFYHFDVVVLEDYFKEKRNHLNENGYIYRNLNDLPVYQFFRIE